MRLRWLAAVALALLPLHAKAAFKGIVPPVLVVGDLNIGIKSDLSTITSGTGNLALGFNNLGAVTTGSRNIVLGYNSAFGSGSGGLVTGSDNIVIGYRAMGGQNGASAGEHNANIVIGNFAMGFDANTSRDITIIGYNACNSGCNSDNTMVGTNAGALASGFGNTLIGEYAAANLSSGSHNVMLVAGRADSTDFPSNTDSDQLDIANFIYGVSMDGTGTTVSSGRLGIGTKTPTAGTKLDIAGPARVAPVAFASLPACSAGLEGTMSPVNNSNTATWGATVAGGGANHVLAYCDGTNWTVMAK